MTSDLVPEASADRIAADLEALAAFADSAAPGWTRRVFTPVYRQGKDWLARRMAEAGLEVTEDAACNTIGTLHGTGAAPGALVTGSHIDTVNGGGRFDGIAGVLAGLEVARCLSQAGIRLHHDLRVVDFTGEEPNDFGLSCVGSRAVTGELRAEHLALVDDTGATMGDALAEMGGDPDAALHARWHDGEVAAFIELHIEQGPVLERRGIPVGVVTGIVGIHRLVTTFTGRPDHAGTTPMDLRRDALCAAAEAVTAIEDAARDGGGVATTGRLEVQPGASNVVPSLARLWTEFRSGDIEWLHAFTRTVRDVVERIARARDVQASVEMVSSEDPVPVDERVRAVIVDASHRLGLDGIEMPSGAGHDAVFLADHAPTGMIFVPSRDGRSHCPEEWTDPVDIATGARVLAQALVDLDRL